MLKNCGQRRAVEIEPRKLAIEEGTSTLGVDSDGDIGESSKVRVVPGATTTGLTVILHHEQWRNILTYAGTIAELTWDDLDLEYLADSRHFHFSSYYLQKSLRPRTQATSSLA